MRKMQKIIKLVNIPKENLDGAVIRWKDGAFIVVDDDIGMNFHDRVLSFGASRSGQAARRYVAINVNGLDFPDTETLLSDLGIKMNPDDVVEDL